MYCVAVDHFWNARFKNPPKKTSAMAHAGVCAGNYAPPALCYKYIGMVSAHRVCPALLPLPPPMPPRARKAAVDALRYIVGLQMDTFAFTNP